MESRRNLAGCNTLNITTGNFISEFICLTLMTYEIMPTAFTQFRLLLTLE